MKSLANEIKAYLEQEKQLDKTNERLDHARDMNSDYTAGEEEQKQVDLLEQRYDYQNGNIHKYVLITCEAFNITVDYFIGCINQYTEVLSYES